MHYKNNIYFFRDLSALRNGSCYRATGRKRRPFAHYINGDFIDFVTEIPEGLIASPKKEIRHELPCCMGGPGYC